MYEIFAVFKWVIEASIMGSVLVCAILPIRWALSRKFNVNWQYYIWFLLLIRLIMPYAPQSQLSIFNLLPTTIGSSDYNSQNDNGNKIESSNNKEKTVFNTTLQKQDTIENTEENIKTFKGLYQLMYRNINLNFAIVIAWILGFLIFLICMIISNLRFGIRIKKNFKYADSNINELFNECKVIMEVHRNIPVLLTKEVYSPCLLGFIRPKLLLPCHLQHKISNAELKCILLHEMAHYKRKDICVNWIVAIVKALHWFNPLIWYGFYKMHQDCEIACDAYALSHIDPEKRIEYGHTIIHLLKLVSVYKFTPGTTAVVSKYDKLEIKRRIIMISIFKKTSFKSVAIAVAIITAIGFTGLTNAKKVLATSGDDLENLQSQKAFLQKDKEDTVKLWAEALGTRDGSFRYAILSNDLKQTEYEKYSEMNWVVGGSSPWVVSYKINEKNKIDDKTYEYEIEYSMSDSTKTLYNSHENVTVQEIGGNWFVINHDDYDYLPEVTESNDSKFSTVQPRLAENSLLTDDKQCAAKLWAEALKERNGSFRYSILSNDLKQTEYEKYSKMNWIIGGSSPWILNYKINEKNKIDDKTYEYEIEYSMTDSTKAIYISYENITVQKNFGNWFVINHDNYEHMPEVNENMN
ncbi:M56 family metallopeptidase [Clostridium uliginosum]|nr:M56 family metallopeptidase [Clostridium uliginosum]